jgi:hypothetical protein
VRVLIPHNVEIHDATVRLLADVDEALVYAGLGDLRTVIRDRGVVRCDLHDGALQLTPFAELTLREILSACDASGIPETVRRTWIDLALTVGGFGED